ncbi:MAG: hypothetical protein AB7H97_04705 [Pseudobdellovibrionaceae bacterium]
MILVIGLVAAAVGGYYFLKNKKSSPPSVVELSFHPDSIQRLQWETPSQKFSFVRSSRQQPWQPEVDAVRIQRRLNLLASLPLVPLSGSFRSLATVVAVDFGSNNAWKGHFDGDNFVWTEGLKAGFGAALDSKMQTLFLEGDFAFLPLKWNWCEQRFLELNFENKSLVSISLQQRGFDWILVQSGKKILLDPTYVEKWLGSACSLEVSSYRDFKLKGPGFISDGKLQVTWADQQQTTYKIYDGYIQTKSDQGVSADALVAVFKTMLEAPQAKRAKH